MVTHAMSRTFISFSIFTLVHHHHHHLLLFLFIHFYFINDYNFIFYSLNFIDYFSFSWLNCSIDFILMYYQLNFILNILSRHCINRVSTANQSPTESRWKLSVQSLLSLPLLLRWLLLLLFICFCCCVNVYSCQLLVVAAYCFIFLSHFFLFFSSYYSINYLHYSNEVVLISNFSYININTNELISSLNKSLIEFNLIFQKMWCHFVEYGNFRLVSARLSVKRHYLFTYFFHSSFRAFIFRSVFKSNSW